MDLMSYVREGYGNEMHILSPECDLLFPIWTPTGEDLPKGVLVEVEVMSSMDDERSGCNTVDLASSSQDSEAFADHGSESGTGRKPMMDHSHGSLDLSQTGPYAERQLETTLTTFESMQNINPPPSTYTTVQSHITDLSHSQKHIQNGCVDLRQTGGNYLHYSGGTFISLNQSMNAQNNTLMDLSLPEKYYQLPRMLKPGLGIDTSITFKPETDYNHNEQLSSSISFETYVDYHVKQDDEPIDDDSSKIVSRVTVEAVESSRIPLTVTSQDDDNDISTDSTDTTDSKSSLDLDMPVDETNDETTKSDRKRPGRKKGQVSKVYHLWEFIRDVLNDPQLCGKVIKWENEEEGIFRVVQSEVAAEMWGAKKNNRTKMTYEKMSRSIRYSRKEGYFDDLPKDKGYPKKLCFKFGKKAHGWSLKKRLALQQYPTIVHS